MNYQAHFRAKIETGTKQHKMKKSHIKSYGPLIPVKNETVRKFPHGSCIDGTLLSAISFLLEILFTQMNQSILDIRDSRVILTLFGIADFSYEATNVCFVTYYLNEKILFCFSVPLLRSLVNGKM